MCRKIGCKTSLQTSAKATTGSSSSTGKLPTFLSCSMKYPEKWARYWKSRYFPKKIDSSTCRLEYSTPSANWSFTVVVLSRIWKSRESSKTMWYRTPLAEKTWMLVSDSISARSHSVGLGSWRTCLKELKEKTSRSFVWKYLKLSLFGTCVLQYSSTGSFKII